MNINSLLLALNDLPRYFLDSGRMVKTESGPWVSYAAVREALMESTTRQQDAPLVKFVCVDCLGCPRCGGDPCAMCHSPELCKQHGCAGKALERERRYGATQGEPHDRP